MLIAAAAGLAIPLASEAKHAVAQLQQADPRKVAGAGLLHVAMLVSSALCWRRAFGALGGRIGGGDACIRYGVGVRERCRTRTSRRCTSNRSLCPESLRERALHRSGTALLAIGSVRAAATTAMLAGAAAARLAPLWLAFAPIAVAITAHGVPSTVAVTGGVAFYVAEAVAGIAFGAFATTVFIFRYRAVRLAPA